MPQPKMLIICAVAQELLALNLPAHIESFICGVGPVEAGISLAAHLAVHSYDLVINVGIAGGFAPHIDVGARVIVTDEYYVELGREDGVELLLPENARVTNHVSLHHEMHAQLQQCNAIFGPGLTSASITTSNARACALRLRFPGILCESMEGFAVARAAERAGVALLELRGISNRVGDRSSGGWDLQAGFDAANALTHEVIRAVTEKR